MSSLWQPLTIGKHSIPLPIVQGGMGVGISWDQLAGTVSKYGGLGTISAVGTGYYAQGQHVKLVNGRPLKPENLNSKVALQEIFKKARELCGDAPLACNILYALNNYGQIVKDACEVGADMIVTGAGLPLDLPEFTKDYPDVALIPIVSSARALKIICKRWQKRYHRLPDAIVLEGPLSGGHLGFSREQISDEAFKLEHLLPEVVKVRDEFGDFPIIAAGGIWTQADMQRMIQLGAAGVQVATKFIGTFECDASLAQKQALIQAKASDITIIDSPVGHPGRALHSELFKRIAQQNAPQIACISNCVGPCEQGKGARKVGFCIADRLSDTQFATDPSLGLYFTGAYGYRITKLQTVKSVLLELMGGDETALV
ncbi:MAG: NAD(P)H-dependent flavin oxidoreductase [Culicoidibacterales bacterium]